MDSAMAIRRPGKGRTAQMLGIRSLLGVSWVLFRFSPKLVGIWWDALSGLWSSTVLSLWDRPVSLLKSQLNRKER